MPNSRVTLMVRIRHATPLFRQRGPQKKPMLTALRKSDRLSRSSPSPPQLSLAVAAFTGARRGEIRGLLWENYHDGEIQITRPIWRGHITEPKTRKSRGAIPVIAPLARRLEYHRIRCGNPISGVMFPNLNGSPTDLGNVLNRVILPTLNRCAICGRPKDECGRPRKGQHATPDHVFERDQSRPEWHGWHAARRGLGTNLYRLGVPEKTIQAILPAIQTISDMRSCGNGWATILIRRPFRPMTSTEDSHPCSPAGPQDKDA